MHPFENLMEAIDILPTDVNRLITDFRGIMAWETGTCVEPKLH